MQIVLKLQDFRKWNYAEEASNSAKPLTKKDLAILDLKEKKGQSDNTADTQKGMIWVSWITNSFGER